MEESKVGDKAEIKQTIKISFLRELIKDMDDDIPVYTSYSVRSELEHIVAAISSKYSLILVENT